ncbi:MAG: hypothetical protein JST40_10815 [Armatimonadetes bacterium]|nr:hypothetical protein [Armatimonadota bacterium]
MKKYYASWAEAGLAIAIILFLSLMLVPIHKDGFRHERPSQLFVRKQGLALMAYLQDNDQRFPFCQITDQTQDIVWSEALEPYIKSWDSVFWNPFREYPSSDAANAWFQRRQFFGMAPRAITNGGSFDQANGFFGWSQSTLTGGHFVKFDGLAGHSNGYLGTDNYGSGRHTADSLFLHEIAEPSRMIAIAESANWDLWWSFGDGYSSYALRYCVRWHYSDLTNSYGDQWGIAGPTASQRTVKGRSGIGTDCRYPHGLTMVTGADGSAKLLDWRRELFKYQQLEDGTFVHPWFWPRGDAPPQSPHRSDLRQALPNRGRWNNLRLVRSSEAPQL